MLILSGDIGATNTRIAFIETEKSPSLIQKKLNFINTNFNGVQEIIEHAITISKLHPHLIGLGVAGPVHEQICTITNLSWKIDAPSLALAIGVPKIHIINDLEAIAWGIPALRIEDYTELHLGTPDINGNLAIIAIGTGLGKAGICRYNGVNHPFASEGGHADFAPSNHLEWEMWQFFAERYEHVSWERIVSGQGLPIILEFLLNYRNSALRSTWLEGTNKKISAATIVTAANSGECSICKEVLEIFVSLYGREAGNYALNILATGGIYLAGGIIPKIVSHLHTPNFLNAFFKKGRMQPLMHKMPIRALLNDNAALYGAAMSAMHSLVVR